MNLIFFFYTFLQSVLFLRLINIVYVLRRITFNYEYVGEKINGVILLLSEMKGAQLKEYLKVYGCSNSVTSIICKNTNCVHNL